MSTFGDEPVELSFTSMIVVAFDDVRILLLSRRGTIVWWFSSIFITALNVASSAEFICRWWDRKMEFLLLIFTMKKFATLSLSACLMRRRTRRRFYRGNLFFTAKVKVLTFMGSVRSTWVTKRSQRGSPVASSTFILERIWRENEKEKRFSIKFILIMCLIKIQLTPMKISFSRHNNVLRNKVESRKKLRHSCAIGDVHNSSMLFNFHQFTRASSRMELKLIIESLMA